MTEILVGIDDSAGAHEALAFGARLAATGGASLRLVSAFPYSDVPSRASNEAFRECLRERRPERCSTARLTPSKAS